MADMMPWQITLQEQMDRDNPPHDQDYWLGQVLRYPVRGIPTREQLFQEPGGAQDLPDAAISRQVGRTGLDYLGMLAQLMSILYTPSVPYYGKGQWKQDPTPIEHLRNWRKAGPPWTNPAPLPEMERYWNYRPAPRIGGPTGQGKSLEEIYRHRAPLEMEDEVLERLLQQWKTMTRPGESGGPTGPLPMPPMPGE